MTPTRPEPDQLLPLSVPVFQILLSLCDGPMHGYAILADVRDRTNTAIELGAGTLYAALKRMVAGGMVEETRARRGAANTDSRRRYYRITKYGRRVAAAEAERLRELTQLAQARRLIPRTAPHRR